MAACINSQEADAENILLPQLEEKPDGSQVSPMHRGFRFGVLIRTAPLLLPNSLAGERSSGDTVTSRTGLKAIDAQ